MKSTTKSFISLTMEHFQTTQCGFDVKAEHLHISFLCLFVADTTKTEKQLNFRNKLTI